jgi:hypothetical protein
VGREKDLGVGGWGRGGGSLLRLGCCTLWQITPSILAKLLEVKRVLSLTEGTLNTD